MPSTEPARLRLAVTGRNGQLARSLIERGLAQGIDVVALARPVLDLTRPATVGEALPNARPDVIVNAAAYTAVDKAESEPELALEINGAGPGAVAEAADSLGVSLIHLSTDYVFGGTGDRPYREDDATAPLGSYGRSKLAGEEAMARAARDHVILRTAWVYSRFGASFVRTMLRLAATRDEIAFVPDQLGCPTSALDLADGIIGVARNLVGSPATAELRGIFHLAGTGETNWTGLAEAVFAASHADGGPHAAVTPIPTSGYPTPARRSADSRLDCRKLARLHGIRLPPWRSSVRTCVSRLLETAA